MPISQIPLFSMLRTKMHWHQERQRLLAENVAHADTPNFKPRDLTLPTFNRTQPGTAAVALERTSASHIGGSSANNASQFEVERRSSHETLPGGNSVSLEDEMLKVAANQMDYQAATALYSRGLGLLKTALGRRG
jgi:flagellar basal-body rod protein FlgB